MLGALTLVDSAAGNARAVLNDVTGTYTGPGTTSGTLDLAGLGTLAGASGGNVASGAGDRTASFAADDPGTLDPGFTAGDYPGVGSRTPGDDGHFASFTIVPEPDTLVLMTVGLIGLTVLGRSRRTRAPLAARDRSPTAPMPERRCRRVSRSPTPGSATRHSAGPRGWEPLGFRREVSGHRIQKAVPNR